MTLKLPSIIGHRGAARFAPENTLESIHTAHDMGVTWVEFDVKLTKDSVPILMHDDTLERTTNGSGNVSDYTYAQISELECGQWFSSGFAGIKIPTLTEALDVLLTHNMGVNIEIKPCAGREIETSEVVMDVLTQGWDELDQMLISSFSYVSLETCKDMAPDFARGFLMETEWPENWKELSEYLEVSSYNIDGRTVTREQIEDIMDLQKPILAYTINDPMLARQLRAWGVDSVFTDDPETINNSLFRKH
jgi:glycerophosphoryl diester phosphodiesterase